MKHIAEQFEFDLTTMKDKYIIHSKSERGFWHNKLGWVYSAASATKYVGFSLDELKTKFRFPITRGNDAEWIVYKYGE